jgi:hypothetical protein
VKRLRIMFGGVKVGGDEEEALREAGKGGIL